jgi:hypothetical protein
MAVYASTRFLVFYPSLDVPFAACALAHFVAAPGTGNSLSALL